jgi:hypothetical protein
MWGDHVVFMNGIHMFIHIVVGIQFVLKPEF